jgi:cadmium resistance protein CadD (predicted permease)
VVNGALGPLLGVTAGSFVSTNVDNLSLTSAQLAAARPGRARSIVKGQLGAATLVVVLAALCGTALLGVPTSSVGLLGLVPITFGLRELVRWGREHRIGVNDPTERWPLAGGFITSALVTIGASADNLAVYIPLFRRVTVVGGLLAAAELIVLDLLLCACAVGAGRHPRVVRGIARGGPVARPLLYLAIGVVVLVRAGTFSGF